MSQRHYTETDYPYVIHTGRELELMLQGKKPFAAFCDEIQSSYNEDIIPEKSFASYVAQGAISRREIIEEAPPHVLRSVLFALPGEEWRVDAYGME